MRSPISGTAPGGMPSVSGYNSTVYWAPSRPKFTANSGMGNAENQFLVNGDEPSLVSMDTGKMYFYRSSVGSAVLDWATAAAWSKATLTTSDPGDGTTNYLRYACWVDKAYLSNFQEDSTRAVQWGTRPGVTSTGSGGFLVAYFEDGGTGNVPIDQFVVSSSGTGPVVSLTSYYFVVPTGLTGTQLEGASISWGDPWNMFVFYRDDQGRPWFQHWNITTVGGVTKVAELRLSHHDIGSWWRMTDATAVIVPDRGRSWSLRSYSIIFPWRDDMVAIRLYQEAATASTKDVLSEPTFMTGGFDDYATVKARFFNGVSITRNDHSEVDGEENEVTIYTGVMEHTFLDGNDDVAAQANVIMGSYDGVNWFRWAGVDVLPLRGGVGLVEDQTILVGADAMYLGSKTEYTHGEDAWSELPFESWSIDAKGGNAVSTLTLSADSDAASSIEPGDMLRVFYQMYGYGMSDPPTYILGTFGVDEIASEEAYHGKRYNIRARGNARKLVDQGALVDEEIAYNTYRYIDFSTYPIVAQQGIWDWDEAAQSVTLTDLGSDPDGTPYTYAVAFAAEKLNNGNFQVIFHALNLETDSGPVFYATDKENYYAVLFKDVGGVAEVHLVQFSAGVETTLYSQTAVGSLDMIRVEVRDNKWRVYSRDSSDTPLYNLSITWQHEFDYDTTTLFQERKYWCGYMSRTVNFSMRAFYYNGFSTALTIGSLAKALAGRSGVELNVEPYHYDSSETFYSTDTASGPKEFTIDTGVDSNGLIRKPISHLEMDAVIDQTEAYATTTIYWTPYYTTDSTKWGDGGWRLMFIGGDASGVREYLLQVGTWDDATSSMTWETIYRVGHSDDELFYNEYRIVVAREEGRNYSTFRLYHFGRENIHIPLPGTYDRGYVQIHVSLSPNPGGASGYADVLIGPITIHNLGYPMSGYVWAYGRPAMDSIRELAEPHLFEMVEQDFGDVKLLSTDMDYRTDYPQAYSGTVDLSYIRTLKPNDMDWSSVVKVTGAEVYSYYVDPELVKLGMRPVEFDSPYLWSVEECTEMAKRRARFMRSVRDSRIYAGYLDPRVQVQDAINVGSEAWIVSGYSMTCSPRVENPESDIQMEVRSAVDYNIIIPPDG